MPTLVKKVVKTPTLQEIQSKAISIYGVTQEELLSSTRKAEIVFVRHLIQYTAFMKARMSYAEIGRQFNRNHTTIMDAVKAIENYIETNSKGKREEILNFLSANCG